MRQCVVVCMYECARVCVHKVYVANNQPHFTPFNFALFAASARCIERCCVLLIVLSALATILQFRMSESIDFELLPFVAFAAYLFQFPQIHTRYVIVCACVRTMFFEDQHILLPAFVFVNMCA